MAEFGWGISEELLKKSEKELGEDQFKRSEDIADVREQIETRPDITFLRTDDAFILRFLRARKFVSVEAFKLLARYFEFRQNNPSIFKNFIASEPDIKASLYDGLPSVLPNCDQNGRRIIVLFAANWEIGRYQLNSIYRAILLTLEKLIDDEANQINGFVFIVDWSQFTFSQSRSLNPKVLKQMVEGLQDCFPARFGSIHFVNQPWYIEAICKIILPFLKEKSRRKIQMHGINLGLLHKYISKDVLPAELGGTLPEHNITSWAKELVGDENFSFGDKHIYWPNQCFLKTRSKSFPSSFYSIPNNTTPVSPGTRLDEDFFLID
ncbi:clavesin-2-like [Crassostrea virginica]|uniref:Clavesin-2-like n=1 Tax=Crassostrea virginica TaxID=6565 RepID=A0A8B8CVA9_CRAVI|nr:clavesin-2-like [Crassostrea virginica]